MARTIDEGARPRTDRNTKPTPKKSTPKKPKKDDSGGNGGPALAWARQQLGKAWLSGQCLIFVARANGVFRQGTSSPNPNTSIARARAAGALKTSDPPVGSTVMWSKSGGAGHTAIVSKYVNGRPYVISTGINGKIAEVPLSYFGGSLHYAGWVSQLNGIKLDTKTYREPQGNGPAVGDGGGGGGGGGSSSGGGGGGGGGGGSYGYSKKEMLEYLEGNFGDLKILKQLDKNLIKGKSGKSIDWLIDTLVNKRITDPTITKTYMAQTGFFKTYAVEIAKRLVEEKSTPGVAKGFIDAKRKEIEAAMAAEGVHLPAADVAKLARDAWAYGWNDEQTQNAIAKSTSATLSGGAWDDEVTKMYQYADDYGVQYSDNLHEQFKQDYLYGRGAADVQSRLREQAASKYTVFADELNSGKTLRSLTDGYFQQAAQLLEVDPDTLDWNDPLFANGRAFTTTGADGKQAVRSIADFDSLVKQDNRWMNTVNAKDTLSGGVYNLMQRMGLAG